MYNTYKHTVTYIHTRTYIHVHTYIQYMHTYLQYNNFMSPIYCFQTSTNFHMVGPSSDRIQKVMKCWWPLLSSENCLLLENLWSDGFCNDMSLPWGGWVICRLDRHWSDCKWQIHQVRVLPDDCLQNSLYPLPDFHNTDTVSRHILKEILSYPVPHSRHRLAVADPWAPIHLLQFAIHKNCKTTCLKVGN